jgi:hypothetical protein
MILWIWASYFLTKSSLCGVESISTGSYGLLQPDRSNGIHGNEEAEVD